MHSIISSTHAFEAQANRPIQGKQEQKDWLQPQQEGSNDRCVRPMYRSHLLSEPKWCEMSGVKMQTNKTAEAASRLRFGAKFVG